MTETNSRPPAPPAQPVLGHTAGFVRDPFGFVRASVDSTGDAFRMDLLGTDVYVLAHPDHLETALVNRDAFTKLDDFDVAFGESLLSVTGDQWARQRRAMEGFFGPTRIREHAETMTAVADAHTGGWRSGSSVRLDDAMREIALQNLFEVVLGRSVGADEIGELTDAAHALNLWFKPTSWVLPDWVPTPARRKFHRGADELRERARALLAGTGDDPDEESLLATLAALRDDPASDFDRAEVLDQVVGMLFAGHETTALAMTYALYQIASRRDAGERFYAEIDDALDGRPSLDDLQALTYLDRLIDETLRFYSPVHAIPRATTERVDVGGYTIPAGAQVLLSTWSVHRDPRFYDDPGTFDPDRWRDSDPRERGYAFVPFGAGPRVCIGRHFARLEMKAVLAAIGRRYRLEAAGDLTLTPRMTTQPDGPVTVRVRERE
jgi:cytochrome P450